MFYEELVSTEELDKSTYHTVVLSEYIEYYIFVKFIVGLIREMECSLGCNTVVDNIY